MLSSARLPLSTPLAQRLRSRLARSLRRTSPHMGSRRREFYGWAFGYGCSPSSSSVVIPKPMNLAVRFNSFNARKASKTLRVVVHITNNTTSNVVNVRSKENGSNQTSLVITP